MPETQPDLNRFFDVFTQAGDGIDTETLTGCFAESFLAGDASGARPVSRQAFLQALPRRAKMFAEAGIGPAVLDSLAPERLDDHYVLVRTTWTAPRAGGGAPVRLVSSYLLYRAELGAYRIVAYLNHEGLALSRT